MQSYLSVLVYEQLHAFLEINAAHTEKIKNPAALGETGDGARYVDVMAAIQDWMRADLDWDVECGIWLLYMGDGELWAGNQSIFHG
jgi:hypothetical protein